MIFFCRGVIFMKITIQPGCISCGTCELVAPEVFVVEVTAHVRSEFLLESSAQQGCLQQNCPYKKYKEKIEQAASLCPVGVIVIDDEDEGK